METVLPKTSEPTRERTRVLKQLAERGFRDTRARRSIVETVLNKDGQFNARQLHEELRRWGVGRATVFRTLDLLTELGVLNRIHTGDGCHRYTVCETKHHHHLMCVECGTVIALEAGGIENQIRRMASEAGFDLLTHHLELVGRCSACRERAAQASAAS